MLPLSQQATPDPAAILAALGLPAPEAAEVATGGFDTSVWRVQIEGAPYALRLLHPGQEARAAREAAAMAAARGGGLPVPIVRVQGTWEGRPVLLLDWCRGLTMVDAMRAHPAAARRLGRLFGLQQAALHAVPAPPCCDTSWLHAGGPPAEAVVRHLQALPARADVLIHLDFHPFNVLADAVSCTGVIDWANASAGDPRADLARTYTILRLAAPPLLPPLLRAALLRFEAGWRQGYAEAATMPADRDLAPFLAWAGFAMLVELGAKRDPAVRGRVQAFAMRWASRAGIRP